MSTHDPRSPADEPADPAATRRGPEPAVLYTIIGLLVVLLAALAFMLARDDDADDTVVLVDPTIEVSPTTPTPTEEVAVVVSPTETATPAAESGSEPVVPPSEPSPPPTTAPPATVTPTATPAPPATPTASTPSTEPSPIRGPTPAATTTPSGELDDDDPGTAIAEDGRALFPVDDEALAGFEGLQITGNAVLVESVVEGEGFWIGTGEDNRVFVVYDVGLLDLTYTPEQGDRIDFTGPVQQTPDEVEVGDDDGGQQLAAQGVSIQLEQVQPSE